MDHRAETRRYCARVSFIGIIAAVLFAFVYGLVKAILSQSGRTHVGGGLLSADNLTAELTVAAVGLLALAVGGILSLILLKKPALREACWIAAGKVTLLSAPFGYIQSLFGYGRGILLRSTEHTEFFYTFAALATLYLGFCLGGREITGNSGFLDAPKRTYIRRVARNTAILFGGMLVSSLLLVARTYVQYRDVFAVQSFAMRLSVYALEPLEAALPTVLGVPAAYVLLSLAARWDTAPKKRWLGKGSILLFSVSLGVAVAVFVLYTVAYGMLSNPTASAMSNYERMLVQASALSFAGTLLTVWSLCLVMNRVRESRLALWGARGLLAVMVCRQLLGWALDMANLRLQYGMSGWWETYTAFVTAENYLNMVFSILSIAALCVLTVGLTRRFRVSKAFWAVPALALTSIVVSYAAAALWSLVAGGVSVGMAEVYRAVILFTIPNVFSLAKETVGFVTLTRAPAEELPPPPATPDGEEPPKPRVEDYLMQL